MVGEGGKGGGKVNEREGICKREEEGGKEREINMEEEGEGE